MNLLREPLGGAVGADNNAAAGSSEPAVFMPAGLIGRMAMQLEPLNNRAIEGQIMSRRRYRSNVQMAGEPAVSRSHL
jgi:hypothetical protein